MKLSDLYSGKRNFFPRNIIPRVVRESKKFKSTEENLEDAKILQLLDTSNQRTYLVTTSRRVYKILDDRRSDKPKVTWSRNREKVFHEGKLAGHLELKSERSDKLIFDASPERVNLVTKRLFANISFDDAIQKIL